MEKNSNKVDLSSFKNPEYSHGKSLVVRVLWIIIGRIFINTYLPVPIKFKVIILKLFGAKIGTGLIIKPKVNIKHPWLLNIGNHCWIGEQVWIDNLVEVNLHNNVCLSQGAFLLTGNHNYKSQKFDLITGKITLEDGVWIGAKSIVGPNVVCYSHSVLAASSFATKDLETLTIYSGNPAVPIRKRIIK